MMKGQLVGSIRAYITVSGSYVSILFSRSNPASDKVSPPVKDTAGNFSLNLLYLKDTIEGKTSMI